MYVLEDDRGQRHPDFCNPLIDGGAADSNDGGNLALGQAVHLALNDLLVGGVPAGDKLLERGPDDCGVLGVVNGGDGVQDVQFVAVLVGDCPAGGLAVLPAMISGVFQSCVCCPADNRCQRVNLALLHTLPAVGLQAINVPRALLHGLPSRLHHVLKLVAVTNAPPALDGFFDAVRAELDLLLRLHALPFVDDGDGVILVLHYVLLLFKFDIEGAGRLCYN